MYVYLWVRIDLDTCEYKRVILRCSLLLLLILHLVTVKPSQKLEGLILSGTTGIYAMSGVCRTSQRVACAEHYHEEGSHCIHMAYDSV
jgi:hypothetical protein